MKEKWILWGKGVGVAGMALGLLSLLMQVIGPFFAFQSTENTNKLGALLLFAGALVTAAALAVAHLWGAGNKDNRS
jgi:hypothetical protein